VSRGTKWRTFKGKRQFNIRAFTYGELLKIDNPKMLKTDRRTYSNRML